MKKNIYIKKSPIVYDALVVGSGITGGWAAKEFCEQGLKTLLVERGRPVEHVKDYIGEGVPTWDMPFRGEVEHNLVNEQYSIQQRCYAFNDATKHFFGNDKELPYTTPDGQGFTWIRGNQLGGKSLLWHRQSYRWSDFDFSANAKDGYGVDWPIRYKDIEDWYAYVEKHVGISGSVENLPQLPDSVFLPPFEFNDVEKMIKAKLEKKFKDRKLIMGRCAHLTKPNKVHIEQGRGPCMARNECQKGCSFGAYFSTQSSTLPAAVKTNNLSIATNSIVHSVIYDAKKNKVTGVRIIDAETMETREYYAKIVFLCASTLGTTQIMLNSTSESFPDGIANSSGVLGHYLMDHCYNASASAEIPGFEDSYYSGRRPSSLYIPRFKNLHSQHSEFLRGYSISCGASREHWSGFSQEDGFGVDFKKKIQSAGKWHFHMRGQAEMLPQYDNKVSLHESKTDKWGMPQLNIDCKYSSNEKKLMKDITETCSEMMDYLGFKNIKTNISDAPPGRGIHEMGTARMGKNPETSVLNAHNQTHDIDNLFVTDGACMTSNATQNPSLTYMAITARACNYAVRELKAGKI